MKTKRFAFTALRPTLKTYHKLIMLFPYLELLTFGLERGSKNNVPHLQGYLELKEERELFSLKSELPGFYLEVARGTRDENIAYCHKECEYFYIRISSLGIYKNTFPSFLTGGMGGSSSLQA